MNTHTSLSFDGVSRDPINRQSAIMLSRGVKFDGPDVADHIIHSELELPIIKHKRILALIGNNNITGRRKGRLVVVGLSRDIPKRWVVRCDCGAHEIRTAKAIRNESNTNDACIKCRQIIQITNQ